MTDKEIIIDGVDVSECDHLKYDHIGCDIDQTYCLGNDCYFKQLKRKEQECQQLKAALQASDIAKAVISYAEINFPIIEKLSNALDEIEKFMIYEFSGQNQWVKKNVLDIINKAKDRKNA